MIYQFSKFSDLSNDIDKAKTIIEFEKSRAIKFGVDYLDDAMVGISPNDLILLGGRSGSGKTELAINIAFNAALQKKNVYYFALEAEAHEVGLRLLYKTYAQKYFNSQRYFKEIVSYDRWLAGIMSESFYDRIELISDAYKETANLKIRYITSDYSIDDFVKDMDQIKDDANFIVIDHLHYFEINESNNENTEYKKIVKTIRTQCLEKDIPVLLVSHIRKSDPRSVIYYPEQEDFHGSSDIVKIATKAITIGSGAGKIVMLPNGTDFVTDKFVSFMKVVKHRRNGSVTHKAACVLFNNQTNTYESSYMIGLPAFDSVGKRSVFFVSNEEGLPIWAQNAKKIK